MVTMVTSVFSHSRAAVWKCYTSETGQDTEWTTNRKWHLRSQL